MKIMEMVNAVQYLKENNFTDNKSNAWINPILNRALNNELSSDEVDALINSIVKMDKKPDSNKETEELTSAISEAVTNEKVEVSEIKEITEVKNFGLLNISQPIPLNKNLNIFYGMNGVGKSTLYKSICGALGLENRKCVPNIDSCDEEKMSSRIKIVDKSSKEQELEFTEDTKGSLDVRIFDSYISNYIVSNDHENEFEVPYLKQEYFVILRELLEHISDRLTSERSNIYDKINNTRQLFSEKIDFINEGYRKIQEKTKDVKFAEENQQRLDKLYSDRMSLESDTSNLLLKSYMDRLEELDKVLKKLCFIKMVEEKPTYEIKFTDQFANKYKLDLDNYIKCKNLYECNNIDKIGEYIPKDWLTKKEWYAFVEAGLSFVSTLLGEDRLTYSNEKCPFCNQSLDDKSKELIKSYNNLKNTCKTDMDKHKTSIDTARKEIEEIINYIGELEKVMVKTFEYIKSIDEKQENGFDSFMLKSYLETVDLGLIKYEIFTDKGKEDYILSVNRIIEFRKILNDEVEEIRKQISDKDSEIKKLNSEIKPLEIDKTITTNLAKLNDLIEKLRIVEDIENKQSSITKLKSSLSKYQTAFSSESIVKLFKEKLYKEYEELSFQPPEKLTIKPKVKTRLCRIGKYKVNEIYSEGELKIHALAEFFATCIIDNFKGVYIFDDPVNSLDYERIDYVKDRIIKLVKEGNQVLVFTHNIYFLYSLMEAKITEKVNEVIKGDYQIQIMNNTIFGKEKEYTD
ncbi:MAG: AAA family ATPase, partial [Endomicrobiaceae bacterium]|nr:AAA family ATPase [Endomicrobiaceae bacterium]